ncbi:MAG: hypothetical protein GX571_11735 [Lentisphaerae bacterium]|jgi:hypothetical protein|nr:hypothetical protein [Lentisphaerota bacterium]
MLYQMMHGYLDGQAIWTACRASFPNARGMAGVYTMSASMSATLFCAFRALLWLADYKNSNSGYGAIGSSGAGSVSVSGSNPLIFVDTDTDTDTDPDADSCIAVNC